MDGWMDGWMEACFVWKEKKEKNYDDAVMMMMVLL